MGWVGSGIPTPNAAGLFRGIYLTLAGGVGTLVAAASGAAAIIVATLAAVANLTNYISSFTVTGLGAIAASNITIVVSGVVGGPLSFVMPVPAGVTVPINPPFTVTFSPPLAATGPNVAILVTVPSFGAGNTSANVVSEGYRL